jgi:hypothetical protein
MTTFVQPSRVRPCDRALARGVLLLLLALFTATFTGTPENPDAEVEFQTTSSLARRGRLDLGGTPEAEALLAAAPPGQATRGFGVAPGGPGREERAYSWFGIGQAVAALPFWYAGAGLARLFPGIEARHAEAPIEGVQRSEFFSHLVVGWRNALLSALTGWLVVLAARRLGAGGRAAFAAGLSYGVATFAWPQARSTLSDVQATFCLFLGFHLLVLARERWTRLRRPPAATLAGAGAAIGCAVLTRVALAPAAACLAAIAFLAIVGRARGVRPGWPLSAVAAFGLPLALAALAFFGVNLLRFGDPLETGYGAAIHGAGFFEPRPWTGLAGLLLAPGRGLLWMAPGILLLPLGAVQAHRRDEHLLPWVVLGVGLCVLVPTAFLHGWHGAQTYGPRYLLPLLPFAWVLVALALDRYGRRGVRRTLAALVLWGGLVVSLPGALVDTTTHHELAQSAARIAWPAEAPVPEGLEVVGADDVQRDDARFHRMLWDLRFAAPWVHWRILRHRAADLGEDYRVRGLFFLDDDARISPGADRRRGQRHLAWVDLHERLGAPLWPGIVLCLGLLIAGIRFAGAGLDDPSV